MAVGADEVDVLARVGAVEGFERAAGSRGHRTPRGGRDVVVLPCRSAWRDVEFVDVAVRADEVHVLAVVLLPVPVER